MRAGDLPAWIRLGLVSFGALRGLGFPARAVFFENATDGRTMKPAFFCTLHDVTDSIAWVGWLRDIEGLSQDEIKAELEAFGQATIAWNESAAFRDEVVRITPFDSPLFVLSLVTAGVYPVKEERWTK